MTRSRRALPERDPLAGVKYTIWPDQLVFFRHRDGQSQEGIVLGICSVAQLNWREVTFIEVDFPPGYGQVPPQRVAANRLSLELYSPLDLYPWVADWYPCSKEAVPLEVLRKLS